MKSFIRTILIFFSVLFLPTSLLIFSFNKIIEKGDYFKLKKDKKYIVFGHSHAECAYNDSIISNLQNYGQSAELYFYTYIKLKKILESNKQVATVFLEFSNYQLDDDWDYFYTWTLISQKYPMYSPIIPYSEFLMILKKDINAVINSQSQSLLSNAGFVLRGKTNFPEYKHWGGYLYLVRDKTDSLLTVLSANENELVNYQQTDKLSITNLSYLFKIIEFCQENKVNIYLIRSPLHSKYPGLNNEAIFQSFIKTKLSNVEFLDFRNFPLTNSEFGDLNHLNYRGAKVFSVWFDSLLNDSLLYMPDKQEFINEKIEKYEYCRRN